MNADFKDFIIKIFSACICENLRPNIRVNIGEMPEMAEGARLEIVCPAKSETVGSNPTLSAMNHAG